MSIRSEQEASLKCFGEPPFALEFKGSARRMGSLLTLEYALNGPLDPLSLPSAAPHPERRDGLWESTCFEAFISEAHQGFYWELNVSPALHWNLYHFRAYRDGRKDETRVPAPRTEILARSANAFRLQVELDLSKVLGERTPIDLGLTAVLAPAAGSATAKSYWALAHLGEKPDFHLRNSFQVRV